VPLITAGFESPTGLGVLPSITDLTPLTLRHFSGTADPGAVDHLVFPR
jgi:hypothetical protein